MPNVQDSGSLFCSDGQVRHQGFLHEWKSHIDPFLCGTIFLRVLNYICLEELTGLILRNQYVCNL